MFVVVPHCGSAHVKGRARKYPYRVCSLFQLKVCKNGNVIWVNTGRTTKPRRGEGVLIQDGKALAEKYNCKFVNVYGSIHNKKIKVNVKGTELS